MYSERDMREIKGRIRKNWQVLGPVLAVILAGYVWALVTRRQALAMVLGPLLFVAACYGFLAYLLPNLRYKGFLTDMSEGLSRELRGTILDVSETPEYQDGAMVLPVRLKLEHAEGEPRPSVGESVQSHRLALETGEDSSDEQIVYLNASKRDALPGPGAAVKLTCFGRHIRSAEAL